jgi:outer membrane protein TolC
MIWLAGLLLAGIVAGCTTSHYRKSADAESYRAIQAKSPQVPNMDPKFTIEQTNVLSYEGLPVTTNLSDFLGVDAEREVGAHILTLEDALRLATGFSRNYQTRKEDLYLSALSLTLSRHAFAPIFSASADGAYTVPTEEVVTYVTNVFGGVPTVLITDRLVEEHQVSASGSVNADWLIRDIGKISTAFSADFLRFVTGDPRAVTSSQLSGTFMRPLLRNAGFKADTENLIQSERQLLYDLRDFTRFRKDFSVQVATAYYSVLRNRDTVRNSFLNLQSSQKNAERSRALAREGRITQSDLGRLEQQELSTESTWIDSVRSYQQALDTFKRLLGITLEARVVLDDRELENLKILDPGLDLQDSARIAFAARLDYFNVKEQLEDADRKIKLAANFLLPQLDFTGTAAINSDPHDNTGFPLPEPKRYSYSAALHLDPGLDRKAERNNYRATLIARDQATRAIADKEDEINLQVRDSWRALEQAKRTYEISEVGVKLAERRVEEQDLLAELARARAQDQVDAQNALIDAKNQRTAALVGHTIARLQLWNNLGILFIKNNGQWEEIQHAKAN